MSQPDLITLSMWKEPSWSTTAGTVLVRMRSCGGGSLWANALVGIAVVEGERTSTVDIVGAGYRGEMDGRMIMPSGKGEG